MHNLRCARTLVGFAIGCFAAVSLAGQSSAKTGGQDQPPSVSVANIHSVPTSQQPSATGGHNAVTNRGPQPHSSGNTGAIAAGVGGAATALVIAEILAHRAPSPEKLSKDGPKLPDQIDMSNFTVTGVAKANWPVALDFALDQPGNVLVSVHQEGKTKPFQVVMKNGMQRRAIGMFRLPDEFSSDLRTSVFQVQFVSATGAANAPGLRVYGMGVGDRAVGSVSIDQLTFQPGQMRPKAKELANYSFHAHSAFDGVEAGFMQITINSGHIVVTKDQRQELPPVNQGDRDTNVWDGKHAKAGDHQLRVRAWRGLENGGDWVVAWSPDIVNVQE